MDKERPGFKLLEKMGWKSEVNPYALTAESPVRVSLYR